MAEIIALGGINVDFQFRVQRLPEPGETVLSHEFLMAGGGKAANVAFLTRRLGVETRLIGHVGDDLLSDQALKALRGQGVNLQYTTNLEGQATGTALIVVQPDGEKGIIVAPNANDVWSDAEVDAVAQGVDGAPDGSVLVANLEVPAFVVRRAMASAQRRGFPVVLDPSPADRVDDGLLRAVDYLTPNPTEAKQLTGIAVESIDDAFRAGQALRERGVRTACMKLGSGGCLIVGEHTRAHIPSVEVEAVDTTGAGDAFAGALALGILEGHSAQDAVRFAVAAAAIAVTRFGAQDADLTRAEIERILARFPEPIEL